MSLSQVGLITATAFFSDRTRIFLTGCSPVLNSAARLVLSIAKFIGISTAIRDELHWLPIRKRIEFKIALLVRRCMVDAGPEYSKELCHPASSAVGLQSLRSAVTIPRFRLQTFGLLSRALELTPIGCYLDNLVTIYYYSKRN